MNPATLEASIASVMAQTVHGRDIKLSISMMFLLNCENSKTVIHLVSKPIQPKWFIELLNQKRIRNIYKVTGQLDLFWKQGN